jgi:hypothetical protein
VTFEEFREGLLHVITSEDGNDLKHSADILFPLYKKKLYTLSLLDTDKKLWVVVL